MSWENVEFFSEQNVSEYTGNATYNQSVYRNYFVTDHVFGAYVESGLVLVYSVLAVVGLTVNGILLFVTLKGQELCVLTNSLLLNLIVADLALCLISMPFTLWSLIRKSWAFGSVACKMVLVIQGMAIFASSTTITMISVERLLKVTRNKGGKFTTKKVLFLSIASIWLFSGIMSTPLAFDGVNDDIEVTENFSYDSCLENWHQHVQGWYTAIILAFQLIIPVSVLSVTYYRINSYLKANQSLPKVQTLFPSMAEASHSIEDMNDSHESNQFSKTQATDTDSDDRKEPKHVANEWLRNAKVVKALLVLSVTFALSWFPWNAFNLYLDFSSGASGLKPATIYMVIACCHVIAMTSTTTNALLYGWFNPSVKKGIYVLKARVFTYICCSTQVVADAV